MGRYQQVLGGCCAAVLLLSTGTARAALSEPVDGMVYDDVLNLCWLQDACASASRTWDEVAAWAENLEFGGHSDWRLARMANTSPADAITYCTSTNEAACRTSGNELGYNFYYNLGGSFPLIGNQGPFLNIPNVPWSGTEFSVSKVWGFNADSGASLTINKISQTCGWAVRSGRCQPGSFYPEPIPALGAWGLGLLGLGLVLLARARLRFQRPE